jgi:GNAT superfamily N-acetyltransferase
MQSHETRLRRSVRADFRLIQSIVNEAARVYKGVIPEDCWKEPYMPEMELQAELAAGVIFWVYEKGNRVVGVMGLQEIQDVALIRHSYVLPARQNQGIGRELLAHLRTLTDHAILVGTWADAAWAVRFYEKNGFKPVTPSEKDRLLKRYWSISERQILSSVVLADERWFKQEDPGANR